MWIKPDASCGHVSAATYRARTLATLALITVTVALACSAGASARAIDDPALSGVPTADMSPHTAMPSTPTADGGDNTLLITLTGIALVGALAVGAARRSTAQRWSAAAGVVGGALWITYAALAAGQPHGCVGYDECSVRLARDLGEIEALIAVGGLLILLALAGLVGRMRAARANRAIGRASSVAVGGGLALIVLGVVSGAIWHQDDSWTMLVVPGMAACAGGFAMAGLAMIRAEVAPRWVGALLVAGSLALFAANDQDDRVLMVIPFGVAWMVVGAVLLHDRGGHRVQSVTATA